VPTQPSASSPPLDTFGSRGQKLVDLLTFVVSLGGHLLVAALAVGFQVVTLDLDGPGDPDGATDAPVGNDGGEAGGEELQTPPVPVRVSVYTPGAPKPEEPQEQPKQAQTPPSDAPVTDAAPSQEGSGNAAKEGVAGKAPKGNKNPCEPTPEIQKVGDHKWKVERSIIDWYAVHLRELEKQAGVAPHKGKDGKRDGARLYLPRCSVLRQAGFRGGDVVHSVNGHKVTTIANGVKTYAKVRKDRTLKVEVTRRNGKQLTLTYKLVH